MGNGYFGDLLLKEARQANRRKCFISYFSGDKGVVEKFLADFGDAFIPKVVGAADYAHIDSDDPEYVMKMIRRDYLGDSTVTICLIGTCTHSRRFIDWELKSSLRQGDTYTANGLLGVLTPACGTQGHLPPRFKENWSEDGKGYALFRSYPSSQDTLKAWIEDAYNRRTTHSHLIENSSDMMKYNRNCLTCQEIH